MSLPAADDLFRPTVVPVEPTHENDDAGLDRQFDEPSRTGGSEASAGRSDRDHRRTPSGRVRHDEKMTVYVTSDELLDLEQARLTLRSSHGLAIDRGRLVREAVAIALADLEAHGDESVIVQRLAGS